MPKHDKWIRTNDKWGLKPTFRLTCPQCNSGMFVRNSELTFIKANYVGRAQLEMVLCVMFKCEPCASVMWFYIGKPYMDNDYWNEVMKWRDNHPLFVPPPETWSEDVKVQQRLKDLGYIGGDIEYQELTELEEKEK